MKTKITLFTLLLLAFFCCKAGAQNFWSAADAATLSPQAFSNSYKPAQFVTFQLNETSFRSQLAGAPSEKTVAAGKSPFIIIVPVSSGKMERFRVVEAPVMEAGLASRHPEIKTYVGQGIDEPSSTIRFDMSPAGFHGMILSAVRRTIYINPVDKANHLYIVFDRDHLSDKQEIFSCQTEQVADAEIQGIDDEDAKSNANDGKLRIYRFAVESGGEFSELLYNNTDTSDAEKKGDVLAALVTDLTRIDGIMEADFGVRLDYVNNEDTIIFLDPATDPYLSKKSGYGSIWGEESQTTLDSLIGPANYDVGHLLMGFPTGGNAGCIGCVCVDTARRGNTAKGGGVTGFTDDLTSDPFVVDFWIHEIGHQFGDEHTFDFSYEGSGAQMEPGSAITIMGYAGTTGMFDIAPHSIPNFHGESIKQALKYIRKGSGSTCGTVITTGDNVPTVSAGANYTIPKSTPFALTATGSDADATDVLTYCWEQFDPLTSSDSVYDSQLGQYVSVYGFPASTYTDYPVFRVYGPTTSPTRYFPTLANILDGTNTNEWEVLPSVSRKLKFKVTVRDNHPGGGQNDRKKMEVTVDSTSGPFKVTVANRGGIVVKGNNTYTVGWDVAKTTEPPVSCAAVNILLSTDSGHTFTDTLLANAPNNGSAQVVAPNISSPACRIMVHAVGNIFFDINDSNFAIVTTFPVSWLSFTGKLQGAGSLLNWATASEVNNNHFEVERSTDGVNFSSIGTVAAGNNPAEEQHYTFTDNAPVEGTDFYRLKQVDNDGNYQYSSTVEINIAATSALWLVYPNPASNNTSVMVKTDLNNVHLALSNANGQTVYTINLPKATAGQSINIPLSNLAKGVYLLKVQSDNGTKTDKIVVE